MCTARKAEEDEENWHLVHFIHHLPRLTPEELAQIKALNPVSRVAKHPGGTMRVAAADVAYND